MKRHLSVIFGTCAGGGPAAALGRWMERGGVPARLVARYAPEAWRTLMKQGRSGRVRARVGSMLAYPLQFVREAARSEHTVLVPTTNPFFLPLVAVAIRPLVGGRVVPLVYDLFPDALEADGARATGLLVRLAAWSNRVWLAHADGVVFIGAKMSERTRARYGEPRRWTVIPTGADARVFEPLLDAPFAPQSELERWCEGKTVISYVGNMGAMHDWETLAEAVPKLLVRCPGAAVVVASWGPGADSLRQAWAGLPPSRVRFEEPLPDAAWARFLVRTDVALATLRSTGVHASLPSKAFSALSAGCALVAVAPSQSDLAALLHTEQVGCHVEPGDAGGLVDTLASLCADPAALQAHQERSRLVGHKFDMPRLAERWTEFLGEVEAEARPSGVYLGLKRALDVVGAAAGLTLGAPLLVGSALLVRLRLGSPVLFHQERVGLAGATFGLRKLRSMLPKTPERASDAERLTPAGRFLRATSLDELPTLLNVLRGDMSLVGPRPLLVRYLPRYSPREELRHTVKPGATGWAQIHGRNAISWNEKLELDAWYAERASLLLDLRILFATVAKVLVREGIEHAEHVTMPELTPAAERNVQPVGA